MEVSSGEIPTPPFRNPIFREWVLVSCRCFALLALAIVVTACGIVGPTSMLTPALSDTPVARTSEPTPMMTDESVPPIQSGPKPFAGTRTVVRADDGQTLQLHVGDTFILDLGDGATTWEVQIVDTGVVAPVQDSPIPSGVQGVYRALASGWTQVVAVGLPPCAKEDPPCPVMAVGFRLIVVVT
jgi:hypothetical protein